MAASAFALAGSTAFAGAPRKFDPPARPEVGTWLIGAAVLAMLGIQAVRRNLARVKAKAS